MKVVYAKVRAVVGQHLIVAGSHWPADDPIVLLQPTLFSEDPRYGLSFSVEPPANDQVLEQPRVKRAYVRHTA